MWFQEWENEECGMMNGNCALIFRCSMFCCSCIMLLLYHSVHMKIKDSLDRGLWDTKRKGCWQLIMR